MAEKAQEGATSPPDPPLPPNSSVVLEDPLSIAVSENVVVSTIPAAAAAASTETESRKFSMTQNIFGDEGSFTIRYVSRPAFRCHGDQSGQIWTI